MALKENSRKVLDYVKANDGADMTAADIAAGTGLEAMEKEKEEREKEAEAHNEAVAEESHSEEVARKNAITDEEAFEQAKKIYINMPEKFKTEKLNKKYCVDAAEKKSGDETVEATEAKKEEAKEIASEIAEKVVDAAAKTLDLENSNQKYPAKRVTKTQKAPAEKKPVKRKTSTTKKEEVTVNEQK